MRASEYDATVARLTSDPIIETMVAELPEPLLEDVAAMTEPTWDLVTAALDTYIGMGGAPDTHIGGPAEAVILVARDRLARRPDAKAYADPIVFALHYGEWKRGEL